VRDKRKDEVSPKKRRDSLYEKRLTAPSWSLTLMTVLFGGACTRKNEEISTEVTVVYVMPDVDNLL
jgi:hypothetical protein